MPSIISNNYGLYYKKDNNDTELILDYTDYFSNLSSIPINTLSDDASSITIHNLCSGLLDEYYLVIKQSKKPPCVVSAMITVALLFRQCFLRYKPLNILEIGCNQGVLTLLLTRAALAAHPDSHLYALSEDLYDETFLSNINRLGDALSNLSLLTMKPDSDMFRSDFFDFTIINGEHICENPDIVINNAYRATRSGGCLLCINNGDTRLYDALTSLPGDFSEYDTEIPTSILVKLLIKAKEIKYPTPNNWFNELISTVKIMVGDVSVLSSRQLKKIILLLKELEKCAIEMFNISDVDFKNRINYAKENALNSLYAADPVYKNTCTEKLVAFINSL